MRSVLLVISAIIMDGFQTSKMGNGFEEMFALFFLIFLAMDIYELLNRK